MFLLAQRPSFWIAFGLRLEKALLPLAWRYVSKRMPPEEEAAWREAERRGQGDEWLRERAHFLSLSTQDMKRPGKASPPKGCDFDT